jgi:hypothetical protein
MLHANTDSGTKHVLSLGYQDEPRLRAIFAHVFCRVLSRGTKFDHYLEGFAHNNRKSKLCEVGFAQFIHFVDPHGKNCKDGQRVGGSTN